MADKIYKKDEAIKIKYQAAGKQTGLTVTMDVYDEADVKDVIQSTTLTEIGATGVYKGTFTPDAEGQWHVQITDTAGGKVIKAYSIGLYNLNDVGANVASAEAKVDAVDSALTDVDTKVDAVDSQLTATDTKIDAVDSQLLATDAKIDSLDTNVDAVDSAITNIDTKISGMDSQLDVIENKIDTIEGPPMIG